MEIKTEIFKKDPGNKMFGYRKWHTPIGVGFPHNDEYTGERIYETHWLFSLPFFDIRFTSKPEHCSCGGRGPDDNPCGACAVYHSLRAEEQEKENAPSWQEPMVRKGEIMNKSGMVDCLCVRFDDPENKEAAVNNLERVAEKYRGICKDIDRGELKRMALKAGFSADAPLMGFQDRDTGDLISVSS